MIQIKHQGRTGNLLLQNIGISIIAKKFNKYVGNYSPLQDSDILGLHLYSGDIKDSSILNYYDTDVFDILQSNEMNNGILFDGLFQMRNFVIDYKSEILSHFNLKYENKPNQVFVHVRLGDITHTNPGLEYYRTALNKLNFESGYIASDSPENNIVRSLIQEYNLEFYDNSPIKILEFAKNFDNLVLSKGTFSWWIGLLSKSNNIYYPINDIGWHGDIFVFDDWKALDINNLH